MGLGDRGVQGERGGSPGILRGPRGRRDLTAARFRAGQGRIEGKGGGRSTRQDNAKRMGRVSADEQVEETEEKEEEEQQQQQEEEEEEGQEVGRQSNRRIRGAEEKGAKAR